MDKHINYIQLYDDNWKDTMERYLTDKDLPNFVCMSDSQEAKIEYHAKLYGLHMGFFIDASMTGNPVDTSMLYAGNEVH